MSTRARWVWRRALELGTALLLAVGVITFAEQAQRAYRHTIPAAAWFEINEIYIPDFRVGEDPQIIYDRSILEWFLGFWIVDVQRKQANGMWATICTGNGTSEYEPSEVIENNRVTLEWFLGRPCPLSVGTYRLKSTWSLSRPGWQPKTVFHTSNEFTISR